MISGYTRGGGILEELLAKKRADKANDLIPQSYRKGKILDVGCGSYPYFLSTTKFSDKYGIDPALDQKLAVKGLKLKKIDVTKQVLPYKTGSFDVVSMLAVFEHIDNDKLEPVLKEIKRILKNKGLLIITTPAPWADLLLHNMAKVNLISKEEIHEHKHNHEKKKIEDIISKAGFSKKKIKSGFFELFMNMWFVAEK